ncbi:MAG: hypothetical protein KDK70_32210, partial [Myxococcales bacterium]|nr:hypothetical protein [Myxococcales bacterium]
MQHDALHRWRKVLVATAGVGVLAGVVWSLRATTEAGEAGDATPTDPPPGLLARRGGPATPRDAGPCAFTPGTRMAYAVTSRTHAALDLRTLSDDVRVGGRFATQITAPQAQQATRRWHLDLHAVARAADGGSVLAARVIDHGTEVE